MENPYLPPTEIGSRRNYYSQELTAVPFPILTTGLAQASPYLLAFCMAAYFRLRGMAGWYMQPTYAMGQASDARIVSAEEISPRAWSKWAPSLEQLRDLEFSIVAHRLPDVIGAREHCILLLLHSSGTIVAALEWTRMPGVNGPQEEVTLELNSFADEGLDVLTGSTNPAHLVFADMFKISFLDHHFMSNQAPIRALIQTHQKRLGGRGMCCMTPDSVHAEHLKRTERRFDWMLQSGLVRKLSDREIALVRQKKLEELPS